MSREKRSRTGTAVTSGTQRFIRQEETATEARWRFEGSDPAGPFKNQVNLSGQWLGWESGGDHEMQAPVFDVTIQGSRMALALFVETKFIPEHVQYKTRAGQIHYQAMLKHIVNPEAVSRIFNPGKSVNCRLATVAGWPYLDAIRLCDLRSEHIRRVVSAAEQAGYSAQTVKHIKNVCFAIIAHAQKEGCFGGPNPASLVKLPKTKRNLSPGLTPEQAKVILDSLHYPHREAALFVLTTGMSLPEICDLQWKDVNHSDLDRFVDRQILPARTVLVKNWWNRAGLGDSRGFRGNKRLEIREPLLSALRELRGANPFAVAEDLVLVSSNGDKIVPASLRIGELKRVGKAVGMPALTWQDLRRAQQAFLAQSLRQGSTSMPGRIHASWPNPHTLTGEETIRENLSRYCLNSHRIFCFGRRFRVSSEAVVPRTARDGDEIGLSGRS